MIRCVQQMHSIGWAHLDLKLDNFLLKDIHTKEDFYERKEEIKHPDSKSLKVLLIDFGMCSKFEIEENKRVEERINYF